MNGFNFDEETHTYTLNGVVLPSPSSVFQDLGLVDSKFFTADSRARGHAAHAWIAEALAGRNIAGADPEIRLFVESAMRLVDRLKPKIIRLETALCHPTLLFAGTCDVDVENSGWREIWDFKSGKAPKIARYQTAAYEMLARAQSPVKSLMEGIRWRRCAIELQADGSIANRIPFEDSLDGAGWLNLLGAYRIRQALRRKNLAPLEQGE